MKKIKELLLATSIIWMPIGLSILIEYIEPLININFNWLGLVLPIPVIIASIILLIYTIKGE